MKLPARLIECFSRALPVTGMILLAAPCWALDVSAPEPEWYVVKETNGRRWLIDYSSLVREAQGRVSYRVRVEGDLETYRGQRIKERQETRVSDCSQNIWWISSVTYFDEKSRMVDHFTVENQEVMQADPEESGDFHGHVCQSGAKDSNNSQQPPEMEQIQQLQQEVSRLKSLLAEERQAYQEERQQWNWEMRKMEQRIRELEESWRRTCPPCGYHTN